MSTKVKTTLEESRMLKVLLRPHVSEKTTTAADLNRQYVFEVATDANKREIKHAVEHLFDVSVDTVQVTNVKPKTKRFRQQEGKRRSWKKAYVKLNEGNEINFVSNE